MTPAGGRRVPPTRCCRAYLPRGAGTRPAAPAARSLCPPRPLQNGLLGGTGSRRGGSLAFSRSPAGGTRGEPDVAPHNGTAETCRVTGSSAAQLPRRPPAWSPAAGGVVEEFLFFKCNQGTEKAFIYCFLYKLLKKCYCKLHKKGKPGG